jgi:hypothetical protein
MSNIFTSWKTTFLGLAGIVAIIAKWVKAGNVDFTDFNTIWALMMSLGLVVAKDANVTGVK